MLLGDINYVLSLGYVLTFLLATTAGMSMLHAFRNMVQLEIHAGRATRCLPGDSAEFLFHFHNPGELARSACTCATRMATTPSLTCPARTTGK